MPTTEDETKEQEENDCIKVIGNELLFYGDVDRENTLEFVEKLKKLGDRTPKEDGRTCWVRANDSCSYNE
jgi:hypothetical protein